MWELFVKGRGNYLESEAGSRDTLWDTLTDFWQNDWKESLKTALHEIFIDLLTFIDKLSFWVTCLGSIYYVWLYAATRDKKHSKKITVLFLTYIFYKMIIGELLT